MSNSDPDGQPDVVDHHFRPFVRALGNLVITFALAEAALLEMVSEILDGDELKAVGILKEKKPREQVLKLVQSLGLTGFDLEELLAGIESFWEGKAARNRLIHDQWFPNVFESSAVAIRGLTQTKTPEEVSQARII